MKKNEEQTTTKPVADAAAIRQMNDAAILEILRRHGTISRTDLWRKSGLSRSAITVIIRDLRKRGFIKYAGEAESSGGRRPQLIKFNPGAYCTIGVDLEDRIGAVMDLSGKILAEVAFELTCNSSGNGPLDNVIEALNSLIERVSVPRKRIMGVGIAVPGIVDFSRGLLLFSSELNWSNVPVRQVVEKAVGVRVLVENDVRVRVLGEHLSGAGKNSQNLVCLEVGNTGLGAAAIIEGRLFRGAHNGAGEIGHVPAVRNGLECGCGNRGCLEQYATGHAILSGIVKSVNAGETTALTGMVRGNLEKLSLQHVFEAAASADALATGVVDELAYHLGLASVILVNCYDPDVLVLCGAVIEAGGEALIREIRKHASARMLRSGTREVILTSTTLGSRAGIVGAGALVYESAFSTPSSALWGPRTKS